jgi:hypothetical protein
LVKPLIDLLLPCTSFGNVDLRGVKAVTTFLADLRMVSRISQDRFLARYHSTEDTTVYGQRNSAEGRVSENAAYSQRCKRKLALR